MNADQVISLTAIVAGALVGLVSIAYSIVSARSDRRLTRELAVGARKADRLHEAYLGMLELAEKIGDWVARVHPMIDTAPPQPVPETPDVDLQISAFARIDAYGSEEVRDLTNKWRDQVNRAWQAAQYFSMGRAQDQRDRDSGQPRAGVADYGDTWSQLSLEIRPAEVEARKALTERIRTELRSSVSP